MVSALVNMRQLCDLDNKITECGFYRGKGFLSINLCD